MSDESVDVFVPASFLWVRVVIIREPVCTEFKELFCVKTFFTTHIFAILH